MGEVLLGVGVGGDTAQMNGGARAISLQMWGGAFQCHRCAASWCRFGRGSRGLGSDQLAGDAGGWGGCGKEPPGLKHLTWF